MHETIKNAVKQAEKIVKASGVDVKFISSAYEIVLAHLLQTNEVRVKEQPVGNSIPQQRRELVNVTFNWTSIVEQKKPASLYQLIALVVDFLEGQKSNNGEDDLFVSIDEIENFLGKECAGHIEDKDFKDLRQRIKATNSRYNYIESKKRGFYVLSPLGRKMIGRLPNQEKNT